MNGVALMDTGNQVRNAFATVARLQGRAIGYDQGNHFSLPPSLMFVDSKGAISFLEKLFDAR